MYGQQNIKFCSKSVYQAVVWKMYNIKCLNLYSFINKVKINAYQEIVKAETINTTVCL